jgi:hypothetical protein
MPIGAVLSEEARNARLAFRRSHHFVSKWSGLSQPEKDLAGFWSNVLTRTYPIHCPCMGHIPKAMVSG